MTNALVSKSQSTFKSQVVQKSYGSVPEVMDVPNLIQLQTASYEWLKTDGLGALFAEVSPIQDFIGGRFELFFGEHEFRDSKYTDEECREMEITFSAPLWVAVKLLVKETGEVLETKLFMGDIPMMTSQGTFVINGAERVVVSQLVRSRFGYGRRGKRGGSHA